MKTKEMAKKKPNIIKITLLSIAGLLTLFCVVVLILNLIVNKLINKEQEPSSWDDTTEINLMVEKPQENFVYKVGCFNEPCSAVGLFSESAETYATVFIPKQLFLEEYEAIVSKSTKLNSAFNKDTLEDALSDISNTQNNDLNEREKLFDEDTRFQYFYSDGIKETVVKMIKDGSVYLENSDSEAEQVVIYRDKGMTCGHLCGSGSKWFEYEYGTVFFVEYNWIS